MSLFSNKKNVPMTTQVPFSKDRVLSNNAEDNLKKYRDKSTGRIIFQLPKSQKIVEIALSEAVIDNGIVTGVTMSAANKLIDNELTNTDETATKTNKPITFKRKNKKIKFVKAATSVTPDLTLPVGFKNKKTL